MDLNKKEAVLCGEALQLTKTEFEILRLLLENEGRVFSRAEILRRIWNNDAEVLDRTVDVNITRRIRKVCRHPFGLRILFRYLCERLR